jgi:hypothetical protein
VNVTQAVLDDLRISAPKKTQPTEPAPHGSLNQTPPPPPPGQNGGSAEE